MITYFVCHLLGVSSCCSNPILYGFLNKNLLKVLHQFSNKIVKNSDGPLKLSDDDMIFFLDRRNKTNKP